MDVLNQRFHELGTVKAKVKNITVVGGVTKVKIFCPDLSDDYISFLFFGKVPYPEGAIITLDASKTFEFSQN